VVVVVEPVVKKSDVRTTVIYYFMQEGNSLRQRQKGKNLSTFVLNYGVYTNSLRWSSLNLLCEKHSR
jgi:hypothetical protein